MHAAWLGNAELINEPNRIETKTNTFFKGFPIVRQTCSVSLHLRIGRLTMLNERVLLKVGGDQMRLRLILSLSTLIFLSSPGPVTAVDIPLTCANQLTFELRTTKATKGCTADEISLGEGALQPSSEPVFVLNPALLARFKAAQVAAKKEGIYLKLVSGFRTVERQKYLFDQAIKKYGSYKEAAKWVAPPEISHHPMGLAMDVNYPNEPEAAKWLEINGYKFGLCRTFKNEWWHFEGNIAPGWKCPKMLKDARALLSS